MQLVVRTSAPPDEIARAVRGIVGELAESAPVYDVRALDTIVARSQAAERFLTTLVLLFAVVVLVQRCVRREPDRLLLRWQCGNGFHACIMASRDRLSEVAVRGGTLVAPAAEAAPHAVRTKALQ